MCISANVRHLLFACSLIALAVPLSDTAAVSATVIATDHYQMEIDTACGAFCDATFPVPGPKHRLNLTRISCWINGVSQIQLASVQLYSADHARLLSQFLPIVAPAVNGHQLLNQDIDMQVGPKQHIVADFEKANGTFDGMQCTVTGTIDTLQ